MLKRLREWLRPVKYITVDESEVTPYNFDEALCTVAMLRDQLQHGEISRDAVAEILRTEFGEVLNQYGSIREMLDSIPADFPEEFFRVLAVIGYLILRTDAGLDTVRSVLDCAFRVPGVSDLPEVREAHRRMNLA